MKIAMIGTGYVGLVSGVCFSDFGHRVVCVDKDAAKVAALTAGRVPIYEPGLEEVMQRNVAAGRLLFTGDIAAAVEGADAVFIAVGTPSRRGDGHADLTYVFAAAEEIARALTGYAVVVTKSTVPVGTNRRVREVIRRANPAAEFDVASNPEFLREGAAVDDFMRPDRVVVGVESERARDVMGHIYRPLFLRDFPVVFTDLESAEMIKYAANAFLAAKITFINEIAALCEKLGADVKAVARGIGLDGRIGMKFLHAGPGYGGSCFPKDTLACVSMGRQKGVPTRLLQAVHDVNQEQRALFFRKISDEFKGNLAGKTLAFWGLAFKPRTDDIREAPAITLINWVAEKGGKVRAYDRVAAANTRRELGNRVEIADDMYQCLEGADALVICTDWDEFKNPDWDAMRAALRRPLIFDGRNLYRRPHLAELGFTYVSIGRHAVRP